jgi:hypothetical protein
MSANGINPRTDVPQDKLYVWALVDPSNPTLDDARPDRWGGGAHHSPH